MKYNYWILYDKRLLALKLENLLYYTHHRYTFKGIFKNYLQSI